MDQAISTMTKVLNVFRASQKPLECAELCPEASSGLSGTPATWAPTHSPSEPMLYFPGCLLHDAVSIPPPAAEPNQMVPSHSSGN